MPLVSAAPLRKVWLGVVAVTALLVMLVCDITATDIGRYQATRLSAGAAPGSINKEVVCLGSILGKYDLWAALRREVKRLDEPEIGTALSQQQEKSLLLHASRVGNVGHNQGRWSPIYTVTALGLNTGLRHSEIRRLRWGDVDLTKRILRVGESKTKAGAGRYVPLNQPAWAALETWAARFPNHSPKEFVFPSCENGAICAERPIENWRTAWRSVCRAADLRGLRFHDLRHTTVTKLLEHGVPYATVAQVLGWSASTAVRMAKRYGHIRPDAQRRAVDSIATTQFDSGVHQIDNQTPELIESDPRKSLKQLI